MMTVALVVIGLWSFNKLPIEAFPDVLNTTVMVITQAPGQSAEDIERKITIPLEREFSGIPKVIQKRSISEFGLSIVYLYFDDNVDKYWARTQTIEKLATAQLPSGIQPSLAPMSSVTGEIFRYEIRGIGYTTTELRTIQDWVLEKEFRAVPGVADVTSYGGKVRTWDVLIDPLKLATYGLSIRQVSDNIANSNLNAGGNLIHWPNQSFVVHSDGELKSPDDLLHVGMSQRGSSIIQIKDIAQVKDSTAPVRGVVGRDERDDIVQGIILLRKGENPVEVGKNIVAKFEELKRGTLLPQGVHLLPYYDRLELVHKTTQTVGKNLLEGLIAVCLVLYLFLRNKYATGLVCLVVPLSLFFAFTLMVLTGTPANLISLGAIDFGIIVDGGVIIAEYVLRRRSEDPTAPIDQLVAEVVRPVFFSMSLIILAYLPIFTLERVEGKMFAPLAWTISFALAGALFLSLTIVPALMPLVLERSSHESEEDPRWLVRLRDRYFLALDWCFQNRQRFFTGAACLMALGIVLFSVSGTEFLPELDEGALWIRATYPHSTSIDEGIKLAHGIRASLSQMPEVKTVVSQLGGPEDGTDPNLFDNCEFFVDLRPKDQWKRFHQDRAQLMQFVRETLSKFPGIDFNVSQPIADNVEEAISGVKGKNAVKIYGPDVKILNQLSSELTTLIKSVRGTSDVGPVAAIAQVPHLTVRVDRVRAAQAGIALQDINDLVEIAVGGKVATQVYDGETRLDVIARASERYRFSLDDIRHLPVPLTGGAKTELGRLASVQMLDAPQAIYREKGYRRIGVKFGVEGRDLGSVMRELLNGAEKINVPSGYFLEWDGEYKNQTRAMRRLLIVIPVTMLLIALVLFILFENLSVVCAVLATLVLAMVGSILLLFIRGIPFSVSAAVGLLALFGVVGLDDITLASTFMAHHENNPTGNLIETIRLACQERFRPLMMTSTLAALGLLPAALSHGIGSETQKPLATAVIGGLFTGLPAVLFFLPMTLSVVLKEPKK